MTAFGEKIHRAAHRAADHPRIILLFAFFICAIFASFLPQLKIAGALEGLLPEDSEELVRYSSMRDRYGKSDYGIFLISGKPVIDVEYLSTLAELHEAITERVPHLDSVESLINATLVHGSDDQVIIEDLLQQQPESAADLELLRQRLQRSDLYYGRLISEAEDTAALFIQLATQVEQKGHLQKTEYRPILESDIAESLAALEAIEREFEPKFGADIVIGGETIVASQLFLAINHDYAIFISLCAIIVCAILSIVFRRLSAVMMPMLSMGMAIVISMALLPILGFSIQATTSMLPSFLLTVCVGDAIHLLTQFYRNYDTGLSKRDALADALARCQRPILLTSLTTAAGLVAFVGSDIVPVKTMGIIAGAGSVIAWLITVVVLPALILAFPLKRRARTASGGMDFVFRRFTRYCYQLAIGYPRWIVGVALSLFVISVFYASKLQVTNNPYRWFEDSHPIRLAVDTIEQNISGSVMFELLVDTGKAEGVYDPDLLRQIDAWLARLEGVVVNDIRVGRAESLIELLKETNRVMNGDRVEHYAIPTTRERVAQALLLVEMDRAEDLYRYTDDDFSELRILLLNTASGARDVLRTQERIEAEFYQHVTSVDSLSYTGMAQMMPRLMQEVGHTMIQAYLIGFALIAMMMILMMQSIRLGLVAMIPNLFPITLALALMYFTRMPLDMFTVVIGPIVLGIAVDDTMHFMHGVRHAHAKHGSTRQAIADSMETSGRALIITTMALCLGFSVYTLSTLQPMVNFGVLMSLSVIVALLADFLVAPALLMLTLKDRVPEEWCPAQLDTSVPRLSI